MSLGDFGVIDSHFEVGEDGIATLTVTPSTAGGVTFAAFPLWQGGTQYADSGDVASAERSDFDRAVDNVNSYYGHEAGRAEVVDPGDLADYGWDAGSVAANLGAFDGSGFSAFFSGITDSVAGLFDSVGGLFEGSAGPSQGIEGYQTFKLTGGELGSDYEEWTVTFHQTSAGFDIAGATSQALGAGALLSEASGAVVSVFPSTSQYTSSLKALGKNYLVPGAASVDVWRAANHALHGEGMQAVARGADAAAGIGITFGVPALFAGAGVAGGGPVAWGLGATYLGIGGFDGVVRGVGHLSHFIVNAGPNGPLR